MRKLLTAIALAGLAVAGSVPASAQQTASLPEAAVAGEATKSARPAKKATKGKAKKGTKGARKAAPKSTKKAAAKGTGK